MAPTLEDFLKTRPEYNDSKKRARLAYLYSDISQARINNPAGFASSVSWWSNLIGGLVANGLQGGGGDTIDASEKIVWHLDQDFVDRLRWEGAGRPIGLGTVAVNSLDI